MNVRRLCGRGLWNSLHLHQHLQQQQPQQPQQQQQQLHLQQPLHRQGATQRKQASREQRQISEPQEQSNCVMSVSPIDRDECRENGTGNCSVRGPDSTNGSYEWHPGDLINGNMESCKGFACLVLNRTIRIPSDVVRLFWQNGWYLLLFVSKNTYAIFSITSIHTSFIEFYFLN